MAATLSALVIGPAISLTLLSAHERGLVTLDLEKLSRFVLQTEQLQTPARPALGANPPSIELQPSMDPRLVAGGVAATQPVVLEPSLNDVIPQETLSRIAESDEAVQTLAQNRPTGAARPESYAPASLQRVDRSLQERYLWNAWAESGAEHHSQRGTTGRATGPYGPKEGDSSLLAAAYNPAFQPIRPSREEPRRSGYEDRRDRGSAAAPQDPPSIYSTVPIAPERTIERDRSVATAAQRQDQGVKGFQPWDSAALADPFGPMNSLATRVPGLRIEQVVLFQGFSSNGYPLNQGISLFDSNLGYDIDMGALATISWTRARPRGSLFLHYTPSHIRRMRFSEWNSTDHRLRLGANRTFTRWDVRLESGAAVTGLPEVLLTPAVTRTVSNAPTNFDDLVTAADSGQLSSEEIASVLTGTPVVESHPKARFDQGRVFASSVSARATHTHSARLSSDLGVSANHFQTISRPVGDNVENLADLRSSTSVGVNAGLSYKLSAETSVGAGTDVRRNHSNFRNSTSVNTTASIDRRLGRRWSMRGSGGVGTIYGNSAFPGLENSGTGAYSTWVANGSVQYSGRTHTISADASRYAGDWVGLGASISYRAGLNWTYSVPGSDWGLNGNGGWYRMEIQGLRDTQGAFVGGGLVRRLTRETAFQASYSYQTVSSPFRGVVSNLTGHRLQMSWVWRPAGAPR